MTPRRTGPAATRAPQVLVILENLPLSRDGRVQRECGALLDAGFRVAVICPREEGGANHRVVPGASVHDYPAPPPAGTALGYAYEFAYSWLAAAVLTMKVWATEGVDAIQACNPPDTYFLLALPLKVFGKPFVFDHHDLAPELYAVRFGRRGAVYRALRALERMTFRTADHVIATNESFRRVASGRGGKASEAVTVVRNGPVLADVRPRDARPELKGGKRFLCCWVGVMGSVDDGVDVALHAVRHIAHGLGRSDCHFAFIGDGEAFAPLRALARDLEIDELVTFTGWLRREEVYDYLASADVALQPDPKNERTDVSTATKTMEYMAFGLPTVAFDVDETRRSAGAAAVYVESNDPDALGTALVDLLDDPERRARMAEIGRRRVMDELAWDLQKQAYVSVFERLLRRRGWGGRASEGAAVLAQGSER